MAFSDWFKEFRKTVMVLDLIHISGLPLPANCKCKLTLYVDKLRFSDGSTVVELEKSRVTNVELRKFTKEETRNKSSFLKSAAGYALFGVAGAIIGALPETKKENVNCAWLIIQYAKGGGVSYILLDASGSVNWSECLIKSLGFAGKGTKQDFI